MVRGPRGTWRTYSPVTVSQFVLLFSIGRWSRIKQMIDRGEQTKSRINGPRPSRLDNELFSARRDTIFSRCYAFAGTSGIELNLPGFSSQPRNTGER